MKTTGNEFFYTVSGLMLPLYMVSDDIEETLDQFVEFVPPISEVIERFLNNNLDNEIFMAEMERLYLLLCDIRAHWLEVEAAKILRVTEVHGGALCRSLLTPFLTRVRTLAVDIQVAKNSGSDTMYNKRSEMERSSDVVRSMNIIITLLKANDNKKALEITRSIVELRDSEYMGPLLAFIKANRKGDALTLAESIKGKYSQDIDETIRQTAKSDKHKKIIVVDDMPDILTALSHILREHYQVYPFSVGSDALHFIGQKNRPDACIIDIEMPVMDGFTLAKKIREHDGCKNVPIIFLTGSSTLDNVFVSMQYELSEFAVKPVNKDIIISKLSGCFQKAAEMQREAVR